MKRLKLQGVVHIGVEVIAYIEVGEDGAKGKATVRRVREGENVLSFTVETIEPGSVTLMLDGVLTKLQQ